MINLYVFYVFYVIAGILGIGEIAYGLKVLFKDDCSDEKAENKK